MSNSSEIQPSLQNQKNEQNLESDVVQNDHPQIEQNPETLKPDTETLPLQDPYKSEKQETPEEEEEEEETAAIQQVLGQGHEQEQDQELEIEIPEEIPVISTLMPPPMAGSNVSNNPTMYSRRGSNKRKKGKGKGKPNFKKQQIFEKKMQSLQKNLNPIPFIPHKILDFAKHEKLLKKLGLWDFVQIDFDRNLRKDLIAQLVASYEARYSCVNGCRIGVNRADLARAFKIPLKKDKANVGGVQVDLDSEELSEDSVGFLVEFVLDWLLLHEDTWLMPTEVLNWLDVIRNGHPEKVDWAGLIWFMVEKELMQGEKLEDCYYASHLQHLMKEQKVFLKEEAAVKTVESNAEAEELEGDVDEGDVKIEDAIEREGEENGAMEGPSVELTLGQDAEKEESAKDAEMMDVEKCKESDAEKGDEDEQNRWLVNGKNDMGDHFMQRCGMGNSMEFGDLEDRKVEEEGVESDEANEEVEDRFQMFPNDALQEDGLGGNFLQAMEGHPVPFGSQGQLRDTSPVQMQQMASGPSFLNQAGKRVIEHENVTLHHSLSDSNKRLRINNSWDNNPVDIGMCLNQIQQTAERARAIYAEKEQALEQLSMNQQVLLNELEKRDKMIEYLHKSKTEEIQKKDAEIYRFERELFLMGDVVEGYKKALKETKKAFHEYRERAQLPEEPAYKVTGPGGLMLSTAEIERIRQKQEEEYRLNCLLVEQKMKEAEEHYARQFDGYLEKVNMLDGKLVGLEAGVKELTELYAKRKVTPIEAEGPEIAEPPANE